MEIYIYGQILQFMQHLWTLWDPHKVCVYKHSLAAEHEFVPIKAPTGQSEVTPMTSPCQSARRAEKHSGESYERDSRSVCVKRLAPSVVYCRALRLKHWLEQDGILLQLLNGRAETKHGSNGRDITVRKWPPVVEKHSDDDTMAEGVVRL